MCVTMPNFVPNLQTVAEIWPFSIFSNSGCPPSWICYSPTWTTHEEYLTVFDTVQNVVGIGALSRVLIICKF